MSQTPPPAVPFPPPIWFPVSQRDATREAAVILCQSEGEPESRVTCFLLRRRPSPRVGKSDYLRLTNVHAHAHALKIVIILMPILQATETGAECTDMTPPGEMMKQRHFFVAD